MSYWERSNAYGLSGFVQCRLMQGSYPNVVLADIEFHAPTYYVNITRHVKGYVESQLEGPAQFDNIEDAKSWTQAMVALS